MMVQSGGASHGVHGCQRAAYGGLGQRGEGAADGVEEMQLGLTAGSLREGAGVEVGNPLCEVVYEGHVPVPTSV